MPDAGPLSMPSIESNVLSDIITFIVVYFFGKICLHFGLDKKAPLWLQTAIKRFNAIFETDDLSHAPLYGLGLFLRRYELLFVFCLVPLAFIFPAILDETDLLFGGLAQTIVFLFLMYTTVRMVVSAAKLRDKIEEKEKAEKG